jgi:uncharacterized protein YqgC (DUF456 family)
MDAVWWWVLAIALIVVGVIGTFLPVLPGAAIVFGGMLLAAWIDHFQRIGWITLTILGVLTVLVFVIDVVAAFFGAKRVGASRLALAGAGVGTIVGMFFGIVGILVAPFIGAVIGELIARGQLDAAARVGFGTWLGMAVGALAKMAVVLAMLGVFIASVLITSGAAAEKGTAPEQMKAESELQRLTAKGTADSLAAAAVLSQFGEETDRGGYAMMTRAVALAPDRADLAWLAVRLCSSASDCDPAQPEAHLRSIDPDNGVGLLGALTRAQARRDEAAVDSTLAAIAGSKRFYVYFNPLVAATAPGLAASRHRGSGQPTGKEMARATVEMIGVIAASVLPPSQSLAFSCKGMDLQQIPGRLERCQRAAQAFERADTFIVEGLGLSLQHRLWPPESPQGQAVTLRRRVFQYRLEEYSQLNVSSSKVDEIPADLIDAFRTHAREQDVALAYIARAGIPADPPADWKSTQLPRVP